MLVDNGGATTGIQPPASGPRAHEGARRGDEMQRAQRWAGLPAAPVAFDRSKLVAVAMPEAVFEVEASLKKEPVGGRGANGADAVVVGQDVLKVASLVRSADEYVACRIWPGPAASPRQAAARPSRRSR